MIQYDKTLAPSLRNSHVWGSSGPPEVVLPGKPQAPAGSNGDGSHIVSLGSQRSFHVGLSGLEARLAVPAGGGNESGCNPEILHTPALSVTIPPGYIAASCWRNCYFRRYALGGKAEMWSQVEEYNLWVWICVCGKERAKEVGKGKDYK